VHLHSKAPHVQEAAQLVVSGRIVSSIDSRVVPGRNSSRSRSGRSRRITRGSEGSSIGCAVMDPSLRRHRSGNLFAVVRVAADHEVMHVEAINIGPSEALEPVGSVTAVAGKGLVGDRHFTDNPAPGNALTLIEAEVLEDVGLTGAQSRRQVVVRGVRLNDLIGKRFRVGDVECLGVEICEPCLHLQRMTRPGIIKDLIHRGGLNADILSGGTISVGDPVSARAG